MSGKASKRVDREGPVKNVSAEAGSKSSQARTARAPKLTPRELQELTGKVSKQITNQANSLLPLWNRLNDAQRGVIINEIHLYATSLPDEEFIEGKKNRGKAVTAALRKQVHLLKTAIPVRQEFENFSLQEGNTTFRLIDITQPLSASLCSFLQVELRRVEGLLENSASAYNVKRFGTNTSLHSLILVEELVARFTDNSGEPLKLRAEQIADLILFVHLAMNQGSQEDADPELIRKSIRHFRKSDTNRVFLELARNWARDHRRFQGDAVNGNKTFKK